MSGQLGFWDVSDRLSQLSRQGDPLEKLATTVDFEMFRAELIKALPRGERSKGGRPPFDPNLKFRMLVLQALNGLSLEQTEFLVKDRLSWMRFCGLGPGDNVLDANTLWDFREALIAADALDALFARLERAITEAGYLPMSGQIIDATLVAAPRQSDTESAPEQYRGREGSHQGGREREGDLEGRAVQGQAKGCRCSLDSEVLKGHPPEDGQKQQVDIAIPTFGYKNHMWTAPSCKMFEQIFDRIACDHMSGL